MLQRRRTDIKANNATIRRQMNSNNNNINNSFRFARSMKVQQDRVRNNKIYLILLSLILCILYYYHEGGDVNDRKELIHPSTMTTANNNNNVHDMTKDVIGGDTAVTSTNNNNNNNMEHDNKKVNIAIKADNNIKQEVEKSITVDTLQNNINDHNNDHSQTKNDERSSNKYLFGDWQTKIQSIRDEFYHRYGGQDEAMAMLERGIKIAADSEEHAVRRTAERIVRAVLRESDGNENDEEGNNTNKNNNNGMNKFTMSFGGYSVTVGRGNYFHQSYPFIMEKILKPLFEESLHLELVVRNSAIGGIPSFPYGWCLPNFLGDDSDIISWDFGMNEGNGADALEAYLRQGIRNLSKRPMMIMLDTKKQRIDLLKAYYQNGILPDSIAVARGEVVNKSLLEKDEIDRPVGLQNWDKWGSPPKSPGQSKWHPKYMEHELIGWMIAMHFVDAIEAAMKMLEELEKDSNANLHIKDEDHENLVLLPPPVTGIAKGTPYSTVTHILHGTQLDHSDESSLWHMDRVSCRSNFLPNIKGHMSEIIVSGTAEEIGDDLMEKTDEQYKSGWVIDVGKVERETKRKVQAIGEGGLGYIDMKLALYAIPESGTLKLSLPHEGPVHNHKHDHEADMTARHWFDALVFCEVNEKRGANECKTEEDLTFIVGGVKSSYVTKISSVASYLKKAICVNVEIPKDAIVTKTNHSREEDTGLLAPDADRVELSVEVSVTGKHVTRADGACSISHVVWQSH